MERDELPVEDVLRWYLERISERGAHRPGSLQSYVWQALDMEDLANEALNWLDNVADS